LSWNDPPVVVTGGASFIGSHLVERPVEKGKVLAVDAAGRFDAPKIASQYLKVYGRLGDE